jgi:hypothetical protein
MARRRSSGRIPSTHYMVRGTVRGWYVCACGCGQVAVCEHCVPGAPGDVLRWLCDEEQRRLGVGKYAEDQQHGSGGQGLGWM